MLTKEERQLLLNNTESLIAKFEQEAATAGAAQVAPAAESIGPHSAMPAPVTSIHYQKETPWAWVKPWSSVIYFKLKDGSGWMRAQRKDDKHVLLPWPAFDGWDEALPSFLGPIDNECGGHVLTDVVAALKYLRDRVEWETKPGRWKDVMTEIAGRTIGPGQPRSRQ